MFFLPLLLTLPIFFHGTLASPKIATAWYAGWHANSDPGFPLSKVSWEKYTQLTYSFAETTPDVRAITLNGSDPETLPKFVTAAHANGVKATVSIGGWTGSLYYSSNVATPQNRTLFVKTLVDFAKKFKLDGLNFDWEYPAAAGIGCNTMNVNDTANFLDFLKELRADSLGSKLILSAAVATTPFIDAEGNPSANVTAFSKVLDYVAIMVYDVAGPWSAAVGPNAPLEDACAPADFQAGSAASAVRDWHAAGFPLDQIVLGVPSYGHTFRVAKSDAFRNGSRTELALYAPFNASDTPVGDEWDDAAGVDKCGNASGQGGNIDLWGMIDQGYLRADGTPKKGVPHIYDKCSQTPFVYNETTRVMISYDDAKSFAAKGKFIKSKGLGGFAMWEAGGDSKDILLDSIRKSAGFKCA
ncbi:glycoside hydrolase family 18 protein [Mycena belliarum]|uniref:Glycoside hydrolase family 18 protein n=1 Tax=Mycena belliarum TaxID=1033014 RepID=A0AAD6U8Q3_9AGAR|nr:glycoside hydrolase family 18 protein [Mycena belliae]